MKLYETISPPPEKFLSSQEIPTEQKNYSAPVSVIYNNGYDQKKPSSEKGIARMPTTYYSLISCTVAIQIKMIYTKIRYDIPPKTNSIKSTSLSYNISLRKNSLLGGSLRC